MPYSYLILQVFNFVFSPSFFFGGGGDRITEQSIAKNQKQYLITFVTQLKVVTVVQESVCYGVLWRSHELQRFPGKSRAL